ncbi:hypothetical protein [Arsenicicoccus dermatophilus]|uniref:hypothetical protein n=1 Tax=Arsenicicoccus dermatophilus TaxID=1076331 RepID=UPI003916F0AD
MDTETLSFLALAVTMLYGVGFTAIHADGYAAIGGVVVALMWMAAGTFGQHGRRRERDLRRRERSRSAASTDA